MPLCWCDRLPYYQLALFHHIDTTATATTPTNTATTPTNTATTPTNTATTPTDTDTTPTNTAATPTIKLVLDEVVEGLQEVEDKVVVLWLGTEEPGGGEGLHQVQETGAGHHGQRLEVRGHCREGEGGERRGGEMIDQH